MNQYTTLFEQQSYRDALDFFMDSLQNNHAPTWDYVILTASNEDQARSYEMQIAHRLRHKQLPERTHYAVIPDLGGERVGSGGATFSAIRYVARREKSAFKSLPGGLSEYAAAEKAAVGEELSESGETVKQERNFFSGRRVLVIHSGGDSKRVPQYSACGKLFSPVPRLLPDGRRSTLFDEFMIGMSTVASRITGGMLVCSGDVLLLFNALQIDFYGAGAAALSIKEKVETGKDHGVYLKDEDGNVGHFLHKQTVETLSDCGAVDSRGMVDIDTGAVILRPDLLSDLYGLVDTDEKYHRFVNARACLSFYADFLYPLASASSLEQFYKEKPEGDYTEALYDCRTALWEVLSPYTMKMICLSPASFIHFGTTKELLHLMTVGMSEYRFLDWSGTVNSNLAPQNFAVSNSYVSRRASVGAGSYIEDSRIHRYSKVGSGCVISGVTLSGETVPDGTVLHALKLKDGRFVCRMYGVEDNPKENTLFGRELGGSLWTAKLYPVCDTVEEAVKATLAVCGGSAAGHPDTAEKYRERISLNDSFNQADVTAILPWQENLYEQVVAEAILENIENGVPADEVKKAYPNIDRHTVEYLLRRAGKQDIGKLEEFSRLIRIYNYLWKITGENEYSDRSFHTICDATLAAAMERVQFKEYHLVQDAVVNLPVRVNWGGGWSDTPPYCMENGGTVLNAAISINGQYPIEASVKRLDRPVIALASTDIGSYQEFDSLEELQDCRNPSDPFALHKAALIACGAIPAKNARGGEKPAASLLGDAFGEQSAVSSGDVSGELSAMTAAAADGEEFTVAALCARLGGGLYMNTRVINIPKGSGLGTSSILAGACVKALLEAFGIKPTDEEVFERVLCMEQLMSTGGGWQDQVGGIVPGIKMVTTRPGLSQKIVCTPLAISTETIEELNSRFALIYTGQRRLARNLLRDVVGRYICNDETSLDAHYAIQRLAVLMRFELEKGNVDGFARLLTDHWEESRRIDAGSTNTCIDQIFAVIDDLIDGRMICGAGGGGFLQVILKKGVLRDDLRERLNEVFQDSGVDVWECAFV
ncbi:MAG: bifunctional fucokinase/L-fucose-1-P-guanylyltransferase [Lachnospiraceae bacterium]|nr:bifunctional fucokinase/L-fucose-1-P-guanylyltransferase [Lachnospiraceae bacterium]